MTAPSEMLECGAGIRSAARREEPFSELLVKEFRAFRVKIDPQTAHGSYSAWREQDHDDLILPVACGLFAGMYAAGPPQHLAMSRGHGRD